MFKKLFTRKKKNEEIVDPPGRTFKRIETGRYFGCENRVSDKEMIMEAKARKIAQIKELELQPKFLRYSYAAKDTDETIPIEAYVAFQKEVLAEKWNMLHVTEISFIVRASDFSEFEEMAGVTLEKDFRNLSVEEREKPYRGEERRSAKRE